MFGFTRETAVKNSIAVMPEINNDDTLCRVFVLIILSCIYKSPFSRKS